METWHDAAMKKERRRARRERHPGRSARLTAAIGQGVVQFQEGSAHFDRVAARVMALERDDLPCLTALLFGGPASVERLATSLDLTRSAVEVTLERLRNAGYARRRGRNAHAVVEITGHARQWIERVWSPLRVDGERLMSDYELRDLALIHEFMDRARAIQEKHVRRLRAWLTVPTSVSARHLTGGLAPAALRRVQVYVEAHLASPIRLPDLAARAGLSVAHFSRVFKSSTGVTPRLFVELRRLARAGQLIESGQPLVVVAIESGFGSQSQLTVAFRRRLGVTPGRFRRTRQQ
jgi:AraC family transcriptional regulator